MASPGVFEKNLALVRRRNAKLAEAISRAGDPFVEIVTGPRGHETISCHGVLLASAYDPEAEGRRQAEDMARTPSDLLVAIGFGLGHHLKAYRARHSCPIVIFEPSLARLRAALAVHPNLKLLAQPDVSLAVDEDQLSRLVSSLYTPGLCMQVYPQPALLRTDPDTVQSAVRLITRAKYAGDAIVKTRIGMCMNWSRLTVENIPFLLDSVPVSNLEGQFEGVPAVIAAAGPSLDRQLPLLREHADRVLVLAIGQTCGALRRAGIEPDLVHIIESQNVSHQLTSAGDTRDLTLVTIPSVNPAVLNVPVKSRFMVYQAPLPFGCWIGEVLGEKRWLPGGATVAQSAVHLAALLGANPILLIGQDLAFTGGRVYAAGSDYASVTIEETGAGSFVFANQEDKARAFGYEVQTVERDLVWVDGWDGEKVPTDPSYASFIHYYGEIGPHLSSRGITLKNCTEGGAYLPGIKHQPFAEALAQHVGDPVDAPRRILDSHQAAELRGPEAFDGPLADARAVLDSLGRKCRAGLTEAQRVARKLPRARHPQQQINLLQGLTRHENRIRKKLAAAPWIDSVVQPEIQKLHREQRSTANSGGSPADVVESMRALFEATGNGVERVRGLLNRLEARLDELRIPSPGSLPGSREPRESQSKEATQ